MDEKEKRRQLLMSQGIRMVPQEPVLKPTSRLVDPLSASRPVNIEKAAGVSKVEPVLEVKEELIKEKITKKRSYKKILILLLVLILAGGGFFLKEKINFSNLFSNSSNTPAEVIREVGKLTTLPQNEEPTIMTVTDLKPLSGQMFFAEAKVGDKVILYSLSRKAILYRPSDKRIITTATLNQ